MNEFLIELQAKLDEAKSKGNINSDIDKIQSQIDKLKIQAEIAPESILAIKKQLEQIANQTITLSKINIDQGQIDKAGEDIGKSISDSVQGGFDKTKKNTDKLNADIKTLKNSLNNFASKNTGFDTFKTEIKGAEVSLDSLIAKLSSVSNVTELNTLRSQANALKTSFTELAQANKIQIQFDTGGYESKVEALISRTMQWTDSNGDARISTDALSQSLQKLENASAAFSKNDTAKNQKALIEAEKELDKQIKTVTNSVRSMNAELAKDSTVSSLHNKIQSFYDNNTAAHKKWGNQLKQMLSETASGAELTTQRVREIEQSFNGVTTAARQAGKVGKSWFQSLKEGAKAFTSWASPVAVMAEGASGVKKAISEMKELDNILTEISKTSDLTSQELKDLGISAYDSASKYGKTASDYLTGVQSMSQSGFYGEQGEAMAEQSLLAQAAGDMSAELADKYILASNAAYKLNGNAEKINEILDGQNSVCNRNSVAMADMAAGMSKAGTVASSYNVTVEDLTAMIGTMEAVTKSGGEEVGNSLKSILINLQNVSSDKITGTLKKANASMTEFVNGAEKLRNPMAILRDLAETFNQLDKDDPLRAEIITNVASKYHASKFSALLQNMDMFDKMLVDYSEGSGSAMEEANKSANNLSGSINSLSNSWNELVNTFVNTDELKGAVNILDNLLQSVTSIVDKLGMSGTAGLGAGLFAGIKDIGIFKTFDSGIDKISSKWGMFGRSFNDIGSAISGRINDINHAFQATDDLIGSIKDSDSIWKRLYPGKESIKSKLIDVDTTIPKLSIEDASNLTKQIKEQLAAVNSNKKGWEEYFKILKDNNQNYVVDLIKNTDDLTKLEGEDLVNACDNARKTVIAQNKELENMSLSAKAGQTDLKGLSIAGNMIIGWLFTKAIEVATEELYKFIHASEIARDKSAELTNNWTEENSSIDESINRYKELSAKLNDASLSASEVKSVKEDLIEVQKSLTDKYGQEALGIDLVNGKYDEQIKKLKQLSKQKAQDYVAENYSNIQEDQKYVTEKVNLSAGLGFNGTMARPDDYSDVGFDLEKYLKKYDKLKAKVVETAGHMV